MRNYKHCIDVLDRKDWWNIAPYLSTLNTEKLFIKLNKSVMLQKYKTKTRTGLKKENY